MSSLFLGVIRRAVAVRGAITAAIARGRGSHLGWRWHHHGRRGWNHRFFWFVWHLSEAHLKYVLKRRWEKSGRVWQSTVLLPKAVSISRVFPTYLWSLCEQQTHTHTVPSVADNNASSTLQVCPSSLVGILTVSRMVWGKSFPARKARFIFKAATPMSSAPTLFSPDTGWFS